MDLTPDTSPVNLGLLEGFSKVCADRHKAYEQGVLDTLKLISAQMLTLAPTMEDPCDVAHLAKNFAAALRRSDK